MHSLSRRNLLTATGATVGAGLVGVKPAFAGAAPTTTLTLYGSQLRILGSRTRLTAGTHMTVRGSLNAAEGGPAVGEFFSSGTVLAESRLLDPQLGRFETHLFSLDDGTITGSGTVHHNGTGTFTITGGSGRYAVARGTYTSTQTADYAGTGVAAFAFEIG